MPVRLITIPHRAVQHGTEGVGERSVSVGMWSARHPRLILGAWVVAILLGVLGWSDIDRVLTTEVAVIADSDSRRNAELIERRFPDMASAGTRVVCAAGGMTDLALQPDTSVEASPGSPLDTGAVFGIGECYEAKWALDSDAPVRSLEQRTSDGAVRAGSSLTTPVDVTGRSTPDTIAHLFLSDDEGSIRLRQRDGDTGPTYRTVIQEDLIRAERFALPLALLVLLAVIRTWFAPFIPILIGGTAVTVAVGVTALAARFSSMSIYVVNMIVMLGLAVGIDYSLLILERFREERRSGSGVRPAIDTSIASAGRAVIASGTTVVVALTGMLLVPINVFRDIAIGAILVVLLGVLAAITLLPALLNLAGDRIDCRQRSPLARLLRHSAGPRVWSRWARAVTRRPLLYGAPVLLLLVALSSQAVDLRTGLSTSYVVEQDVGETTSTPDNDYWEQEVTTTLMSMVEIVVDERQVDEADLRIEQLISRIGQDDDFAPVVTLQTNDSSDLSIIRALVVRLPGSDEAASAVKRLRTDLVPGAFGGAGSDALIAGPLVLQLDVVDIVETWQWRIMAVIVGMSFVVLTLVFRSIIVPLVATLMTLLSVSAAIGVLVLVIQKGIGASVLGLQQAPTIEVWVPIVLYSVLFGLSMDYHVFLLSRVREHYRHIGDDRAAVAFGVRATGGIICGAALIMVIVFGAFASGRLLILQQIGFGLAVAILIDAFLVRLILVPSIMAILGRWNWYLLGWRPGRPVTLRGAWLERG